MNAPRVNVEEVPGKTVGSRASEPVDYDRLVDAAEGIMPRLPFPKGVYRFRSFEEADAWTEMHILRAARTKDRSRRGETT
jgi:hypothetical protein